MEVKYRLKWGEGVLNQDILLYFRLRQKNADNYIQAAFRVHIQDILYKTWQYNILIKTQLFLISCCGKKSH